MFCCLIDSMGAGRQGRERQEPVNGERKIERFLMNYAILPHSLTKRERHALTRDVSDT